MKTLRDLFMNELADIYDAEQRMVVALGMLEKVAAGAYLKQALRSHARETTNHTARLSKVFQLFETTARSRPCEATIGLLREVDEIVGEFSGSPVIDAAVISAAQKIEHYEIVTYGCLHAWAEQLGNKGATVILRGILDQERASDQRLTRLARGRSNQQALGERRANARPSTRLRRTAAG